MATTGVILKINVSSQYLVDISGIFAETFITQIYLQSDHKLTREGDLNFTRKVTQI